jgi:hypothetical protein
MERSYDLYQVSQGSGTVPSSFWKKVQTNQSIYGGGYFLLRAMETRAFAISCWEINEGNGITVRQPELTLKPS